MKNRKSSIAVYSVILCLVAMPIALPNTFGTQQGTWRSQGNDVVIGSSWNDPRTGEKTNVALAVGYRNTFFGCDLTISFLIFKGNSIGKSIKERKVKKYGNQLELVVNKKAFTSATQLNTYPNDGMELAIKPPNDLIDELQRAQSVTVKFAGSKDGVITWNYGRTFVPAHRENKAKCD